MEDLAKKMQHIIENLEEKYITVNGVRVRYVEKGSSSPVLLLHGFGEFLESWVFNIDPLSEHYRVYALDLPGHGLSETVEPYTLDQISEVLIKAIPESSFNVLGWSLGDSVALTMAYNFPQRVNSFPIYFPFYCQQFLKKGKIGVRGLYMWAISGVPVPTMLRVPFLISSCNFLI